MSPAASAGNASAGSGPAVTSRLRRMVSRSRRALSIASRSGWDRSAASRIPTALDGSPVSSVARR